MSELKSFELFRQFAHTIGKEVKDLKALVPITKPDGTDLITFLKCGYSMTRGELPWAPILLGDCDFALVSITAFTHFVKFDEKKIEFVRRFNDSSWYHTSLEKLSSTGPCWLFSLDILIELAVDIKQQTFEERKEEWPVAFRKLCRTKEWIASYLSYKQLSTDFFALAGVPLCHSFFDKKNHFAWERIKKHDWQKVLGWSLEQVSQEQLYCLDWNGRIDSQAERSYFSFRGTLANCLGITERQLWFGYPKVCFKKMDMVRFLRIYNEMQDQETPDVVLYQRFREKLDTVGWYRDLEEMANWNEKARQHIEESLNKLMSQ